ncbi:PAS domain S-box protein [Flaviaesturariibacter flavus]|uniref:Oxygen sensor histidine kinase NreB n=1 Tax=Flaviaesturariibacter flavus TaxID=2502780 RepID=A0A4R1BBQ3_9BACT|nr:PAS domain S-box protein [Flaviaesturariibacter flavus]TCJ14439.1 PAS domain S-box protein [Flaviaesturariibacter flavus]
MFSPQPSTQDILESISDGFVFYDRDGIVQYWNRRAEEFLGIPRSEIIGRNLWSCFPEETGKLFYQRYARALELQEHDVFEGYLGRADRWFLVDAYPSPGGLGIFFRDVTERHNRERELEETRARFELVLQATHEAICDVDLVQQHTFWHGDNLRNLFGHDPSVSGTPERAWLDHVHPDDLERVLREYNDAIANGADGFATRYRFRRADGTYAVVRGRTVIVRDEAGVAVRAVTAMEDVTAEEKNIHLLRQREAEFRLLFDNAPLPQWIFDRDTFRILDVNEAALIEYGYTREQFLGLTLLDLRPPEDRAGFRELVEHIQDERKNWANLRHVRSDGSILHVEVHAAPVQFRGQAASLATVNNVTRYRDAKQALRKSQEDYKRLFNNAPLPQCISSCDGQRIIEVNEAATALYGYSREELLAMSAFDLSLPEDHAALREGIRLVLRTGSLKTLSRHRVKGGALIIVEVNAALVDYEGDACLMVTINDITYERQLEENITALKVSAQKMVTRAQLNAQEEERAEIGRELHDNINQQLTSVKLHIGMARSRPDMAPELLARTEGLVQDAINGIRALSKNLVQPLFGEEGLPQALAELCASFESTAGFAVTLEVSATVDDPELALTLYRVVQEALTNVSKYAAASQVRVALAEVQGNLRLTVADDGRGFDPGIRGKGIGLINMERRMDLFNGRLEITAAPGHGCTLTATLPVPGADGGALFVAIAEDDADDRELLELAFRELVPQCRLHFAGNGMELLEHLRATTDVPDLIVIDQNMPLLNGIDTLQALGLEPRFRRVPKVLYSTTIRSEYRRGAYAAAYIEKSHNLAGIKNSVRQMLVLVRGRR